jgi:DNA (cytosine-5)-methyltransferase 1
MNDSKKEKKGRVFYKVLNLYACLGGNRLLWGDCHVTAVELDPELARMYQERFQNDTVIIGDAHQYLLDHYKEFDFIWSSPPCPTHSRIQTSLKNRETFIPAYPDMKLYEEIIFLEQFFEGKYCIENVIPYYEPLIAAKKRDRHLYWTNFNLPNTLSHRSGNIGGKDEVKRLCEFHDYDFYKYKGVQRINKIARNLVDYEAGKTIFNTAMNIVNSEIDTQSKLF